MDIESTFQRQFISAVDLPDSGDVTVTIESVRVEDVAQRDGSRARKPVVTLAEPITPGGPTRWVLNRTNTKTCKAIIGSGEPSAWRGQTVRLYKTEVPFGPEVRDGIRVRSQAPKPAPVGEHVLADGDEIPF